MEKSEKYLNLHKTVKDLHNQIVELQVTIKKAEPIVIAGSDEINNKLYRWRYELEFVKSKVETLITDFSKTVNNSPVSAEIVQGN